MNGDKAAKSANYEIPSRKIRLDDSWDVIVVGGGPSGSAAATASARQGARTLLIEAEGALGGMGTLGLVPWFCGYGDGEKVIARGLAERVRQELIDGTPHLAKQSETECVFAPDIDPELLMRIYDNMVVSSGATVLFHSFMCAVEKTGSDWVDALLVGNKAGLTAYRAKVYVDCTGDGDLATWAGAKYEKGDKNGKLQAATSCFILNNIDEYALKSGPNIHFFDPESPIHKIRTSDKYPLITDLHTCNTLIGPGAYGFNTGHLFDVDNTDPENISQARILGREQSAQYRNAFAEYHPAFKNAALARTGALLGVRETRRIIGDYVLNVDDYLSRRSFPDEICRNAYNIDVHETGEESESIASKPIEEIKQWLGETTRPLEPGESYGVPYRCLTPLGLKNVLVAGRSISTDRQVNGSVRIMACCLTTGEAAGVAAALSASTPSPDVRAVDTDKLRSILIDNGAYLP